MPAYTTTSNKYISTGRELGKGGEGIVYDVSGYSDQVAKIYHPSHRTSKKERKLQAMIDNPPQDDTRRLSPPHISIAWPLELLYEQRQFAGYLMPRIDQSPDIFEVYNPQLRAKNHTAFNWRYLHRTAKNFATALNALHMRGYVMGDVNQKNVLVTTSALVTLVDTDSFQVPDPNGRIYRCPVGVPEYTPPELQGARLDSVDRTPHHDGFGLAIIIFQLLMEGFHPFMGAPRDPTLSIFGEMYLHCIKRGIFPYQSNNEFNPPPGAPVFNTLHPEIQNLFLRCFVIGYLNPSSRPTAREWLDTLDKAESALVQCRQNSSHWYSNHTNKCPWCERDKQKPLPIQQSLPPIQHQVQRPVYTPPRPVYTPQPQPPSTIVVSNKSPMVAALLSFFLMGGAGQIYLGQTKKGIALIVATLVTALLGLSIFISLAGVIDAYSIAKKMNQGIAVGEWDFSFSGKAVIVVGVIIIGIIIIGVLVSSQ